MPRHARVLSKTQTYHVMLRGNNRQEVFIDDEDKARIIATIWDKKGDDHFTVYAYCVMDNHLHLVLREGKDVLAKALKRIGTSYAYYFNKKYKRIETVMGTVPLTTIIRYDKIPAEVIKVPRHARVLSKTQTYHVMLRGNNRQEVFIDDEDKARIIATIWDKKGDDHFTVYAYCVMDNHLHLVLREGKDVLAKALKRIGTSYAYYFNKKYKRIGHVFQDRYRSESVEDDAYLIGVIRYVHQNPEKAGISSTESYPWSSYNEYFKENTRLIAADEVLNIFSNDRKKAIDDFKKFHQEDSGGLFLDLNEKKQITEENVRSVIEKYLKKRKLEINDLKLRQNKAYRDDLIKFLLKESDLSLRRMADLLRINREIVRRTASSMSVEPSR